MNYLSAELIGKTYHDKWLFRELTLGISQGEKLVLVGENGAGKSTLLRILTGEIQSDGGTVVVREGLKTAFLTQQPVADDKTTIADLLFSDKNEVARTVREYEHCIHHPDTSPEKMQQVLERMEELRAWDYESRVQEVTSRLGLNDLDQVFGNLSGGQRKRVFLAQVLLASADLLILDEPTNHLDLEALEWLEQYLSGKDITLLMVTHDRYFLDQVSTGILELDRGKLYRYNGNYSYFLEKKSEREEMLKSEVAKARNLLKKELEWMRRQPKARGTKAKYRVDAFYELQAKASQSLKKDRLELDIQEARQGGKILELHHVSSAWGGLKTVDDFTYTFKKGDRIGVVGKNGVGKSTFLNLVTGQIKPASGEILPGLTTKFGYFRQETADLNPSHRLIEEVKEIAEFITLSDGSQVSASKFLDQFLFPPEKQYTFIEKLSGGEKKRLQLLKVLVANPNFLILDEPTNDFDIETLNVLEEFLENFSGCLLLVSHDRYFMDRLVDQLFVFEGDGKIRVFNGNYSDYREELAEAESKPAPAPVRQQETQQPSTPAPAKKKVSMADRKELDTIQAAIDTLEQEEKKLTAELNDGTGDHLRLNELAKAIGEINAEIEKKTARWMELEEKINGGN
ncbi:MAG: ABC-F family ATP-binding cassette domain-containing protein [Bacteroidota bacterium]